MSAVAIKKGQSREKAMGLKDMGSVRCDGCGEEFVVNHEPASIDNHLAENRQLGSKRFLQMITRTIRSTPTESNCFNALTTSRDNAEWSTSLMSSLRCRALFPVIGRQGYSPNILRLIKLDPAVQRILRIDINYPSPGSLVSQVDIDRNSHPRSQSECRRDQCSVDVDDNSLSVASPTSRIILKRNNHLQRDTSAASGIAKCRLRRHG